MHALVRYAAEEKKAFALLAEPRVFLAERGILVRPLDVKWREWTGTMAMVEVCRIRSVGCVG